MFFSVPVYGVRHIDVPGRKLKDLPGGTHPAVWVRLNLQEVRGQAVVGVLRSWRNVQLQLGCGECVSSQRKGKGVLKSKESFSDFKSGQSKESINSTFKYL